MYFPAAGIEIHPLVPPLVAFVITFFTSMGGVSGAFLLLPFQLSVLGYTNPSVSSTNQFFNIVAIPSGVWQYIKEGRMLWPLTWIVIAGTLPGVFIGAIVRVKYLPDPRHFKLFVASVLLYLGVRMMKDLLKRKSSRQDKGKTDLTKQALSPVLVIKFTLSELRYEFNGEEFQARTMGIFILSLIVGVVGGVYGIGGGSIIAPFFVACYGLPVYTIAGAALMGTFVTSVAGVAFYQGIAPFYPGVSVAPDWTLGILFGLGGMCGMYLGARCQKYVSAKVIKWMLSVMVLFLSLKYLIDFLE